MKQNWLMWTSIAGISFGPDQIYGKLRGHTTARMTSTINFSVDLSNAICPGLVAKNKLQVPDMAACGALCESDAGCDAWQYCPAPLSCLLDPDTDEWTPGDWTRCYVSTADVSRDNCVPDRNENWKGMAQSGSMRVPSRTSPVELKRGFSGYLDVGGQDNNTILFGPVCHDAEVLGLSESWYYTWTPNTSGGGYCRNSEGLFGAGSNGPKNVQMGSEFVPMMVGLGQAQQKLLIIDDLKTEWNRANVHFLLGYNEPDPAPNHPHSEPNHTKAAEDWVYVQEIADSFDPPLRLVSPAPASEDFDEAGRSAWLDLFFGNCTHVVEECHPDRIEFVAFHDYVGNPTNLEFRLNAISSNYGDRKLWLTEYAIGRWDPPNGPSREEQNQYMKDTLPILENHPNLFRYIWFSSRNGPGPWGGVKDLLVWNNPEPTITSTGTIYKEWPHGVQNPLPIYEPAPGLFLILSEPGGNCIKACSERQMQCTAEALQEAAPYGGSDAIAQTASALGVTCAKVKSDRNGFAFPQIRPDLSYCHGKNKQSNNFRCNSRSTWVVKGQRICACKSIDVSENV